MGKKFAAAFLLAAALALVACAAQKPAEAPKPAPQAAAAVPAPHETTSDVPELEGLHEVIYPLWHEAWPNKDVMMMKELLPKAEKAVEAVQNAKLPGILRDKQAKWDAGVAELAKSLEAYKKAAAASDQQGLLDAVEQLHARFEKLVRIVYPKMKELDAYHQVLYQIYHFDWPNRKLDALNKNAEQLAAKCSELQSAAIPKRLVAKEAELKAAFNDLCAATTELVTVSKGKDVDAIGKAVEKVHTAYQKAEGACG